MPQLAKGGKYVYGWILINEDFSINLPDQIITEYNIQDRNTLYLMTGSKSTGGFCVLTKELLENSKINSILNDNKGLAKCSIREQEYITYKGRKYCWTQLKNNKIYLTKNTLRACNLKVGNKLLSIRSSDIAFTLGGKGPLVEYAHHYSGEIKIY